MIRWVKYQIMLFGMSDKQKHLFNKLREYLSRKFEAEKKNFPLKSLPRFIKEAEETCLKDGISKAIIKRLKDLYSNKKPPRKR